MLGMTAPTNFFLVFEDFLFETNQTGEITVGKIELVIFSHRYLDPKLESATNKQYVDDNCLSVFGTNKI